MVTFKLDCIFSTCYSCEEGYGQEHSQSRSWSFQLKHHYLSAHCLPPNPIKWVEELRYPSCSNSDILNPSQLQTAAFHILSPRTCGIARTCSGEPPLWCFSKCCSESWGEGISQCSFLWLTAFCSHRRLRTWGLPAVDKSSLFLPSSRPIQLLCRWFRWSAYGFLRCVSWDSSNLGLVVEKSRCNSLPSLEFHWFSHPFWDFLSLKSSSSC